MNTRPIRLAAALLSGLLLSAPAGAQEFPTKPVRIVVPFGAGSGLDIVMRFVADRMAKEWSQPVIVENRPGATGVIGTEQVYRAPADGYTLLATTQSLYTGASLVSKLAYDPVKDFTPVARISSANLAMVVATSSPIASIQSLVNEAKAKPTVLTYATLGAGSTAHLAGALFNLVGGISVTAVHYKETSQAMADTMSGTVSMNFVAIPTASAQIKVGRLKPVAVTGPSRSKALPDVPTVAEAGVPGYEFVAWHGLFARASTPPALVRKIAEDVMKVGSIPEFSALLQAQGLDPNLKGPAELAVQIPQEAQRLSKIMADAGVKRE